MMAEEAHLVFNNRKMKPLGIMDTNYEFTNLGLLVSDENPKL